MASNVGDTFTVLASATRSSKQTEDLANVDGAQGVTVIVDASASSGDGTEDLQVTISMRDPVSGNAVQLIQDTAFTDGGTGTVAYQVGPGIADTQTAFAAIQATLLSKLWRIEVEVLQGGGGTVDYTYSVSANYH